MSHAGGGPGAPRWKPAVASLAVFLVALTALLFVLAGRTDWVRGWLFVVVLFASMTATLIFLWRTNPEIFEARRTIHKGTRSWDVVLLTILLPAMLAVFIVAAIDDGRFRWSSAPSWVVGLGYVLFLAGFALATWAQAANRFFEPGVRIQTERGHHVVDAGPYAIVRHPGYLSFPSLFAGVAMALGSFWALVPVGIVVVVLVIRTVWEDQTLHRELPGYAAYARRVRFRLIPGIW